MVRVVPPIPVTQDGRTERSWDSRTRDFRGGWGVCGVVVEVGPNRDETGEDRPGDWFWWGPLRLPPGMSAEWTQRPLPCTAQ